MPPAIDEVRAALGEIAATHQRIENQVANLTAEQLRAPSLLEGWSRAHVVAHLANNAMAFVGMLSGVLGGELVAQYPGGDEQRALDIEARSTLRPLPLGAMLSSGHVQFEAAAGALDDDQWYAPTEARVGLRPAWALVWSRWREAEVHLVDMDAGFDIADWSTAFVDVALAAERRCLVRRLPDGRGGEVETSGDDRQLLWWLMGREGANIDVLVAGRALAPDDLVPWGESGWMPGIPDRS
jgi:maleylpyruvate isomerase